MKYALILLLALCTVPAPGQTSADSTSPTTSADPSWQFDASVSGYIFRESTSYVQPTFAANHRRLHLEGRYNNEGLHTGSAWVGYNFSVGHTVEFSATPMVGVVFGAMNGGAPGYELSLTWKKLEVSTTGEVVFFANDRTSNFFYSWAQAGYSPTDWLSLGIASQKTRAYQTALNVQRGVFMGFSHRNTSLTTYVFNAGWTEPSVVLTLGYTFASKKK